MTVENYLWRDQKVVEGSLSQLQATCLKHLIFKVGKKYLECTEVALENNGE